MVNSRSMYSSRFNTPCKTAEKLQFLLTNPLHRPPFLPKPICWSTSYPEASNSRVFSLVTVVMLTDDDTSNGNNEHLSRPSKQTNISLMKLPCDSVCTEFPRSRQVSSLPIGHEVVQTVLTRSRNTLARRLSDRRHSAYTPTFAGRYLVLAAIRGVCKLSLLPQILLMSLLFKV